MRPLCGTLFLGSLSLSKQPAPSCWSRATLVGPEVWSVWEAWRDQPLPEQVTDSSL